MESRPASVDSFSSLTASSAASASLSSNCKTGSGEEMRQLKQLVGECVRISSTHQQRFSAPSTVYGMAQCCNGRGIMQYCSDSLCMRCFQTIDVPLGRCLAPLQHLSSLDGDVSLSWHLHACTGQTPLSSSAAIQLTDSARLSLNDNATTSRLTSEQMQVFLHYKK